MHTLNIIILITGMVQLILRLILYKTTEKHLRFMETKQDKLNTDLTEITLSYHNNSYKFITSSIVLLVSSWFILLGYNEVDTIPIKLILVTLGLVLYIINFLDLRSQTKELKTSIEITNGLLSKQRIILRDDLRISREQRDQKEVPFINPFEQVNFKG